MKLSAVSVIAFVAGATPSLVLAEPPTTESRLLEAYYLAYPQADLVRSRNVAKVTSPGTGIYCVTPNRALPNKIFPQVSMVYTAFAPNGAVAWQDPASDCGAGDVEVKTFYSGAPSANINFVLRVAH